MRPIELAKKSFEYQLIKEYYKGAVAERSQVPLINHIDEGLDVLNKLNAWTSTMQAFCLHPILQDDLTFGSNWKKVCKPHITVKSVLLAMEYRRAANAYLCRPATDSWTKEDIIQAVGIIIPPVRAMLIADKIQNYKDFIIYHQLTHERSQQLTTYFENWLEILDAKTALAL